MKTRPNGRRVLLGVSIALALVREPAFAATYYYVGASNQWNSAACYSTISGGAGGAGIPGASDRVVLSAGQTVYVDDSTISFFSTIKEVQVAGHNVFAFFDIAKDASLGCNFGSLNASMWTSYLVKTGAGKLTVAKQCPSEYISGGHCYGNFIGLDVREGTLVMEPSTGNNYHRYSDVRIAEGATVCGVTSGVTWLNTLNGAGTLTTTGSSAELRIAGTTVSPCVFSGKITGYKIFRPSGHVWLTGTENAMAGGADNFVPYNYSSGFMDRGIFGFMTWAGGYGTPSSFGTGHLDATGGPFRFLYLGETGETIQRTITLRNTAAAPATIDAGAHGGLVFAGAFTPRAANGLQQRFEFTGSNTVHACIFSNQFQRITVGDATCSFFVKKTGSGIWRFANRDATDQMSGVIGAEQGTLEFETVRNAGLPSSLGRATDLYEDKCAAPSALAKVPYANYLGDGSTNEAVFSYLGLIAPYVYDRPLAVNGAGRFRAPNCEAYAWSGFRALGAGDSKIVLECAEGQVNKAAGFVDGNAAGGEGTLSVEKDGPGDLVISGDLSFGGDLIAKGGGTLTVKDVNGLKYSYYRLNLKENVAVSTLPEYADWHQESGDWLRKFVLNEFGLYAANGGRHTYFNYNGYATNRYVVTLPANKIALENEELFTIANAANASIGGAGRLVDNYNSGGVVMHLGWSDASKKLDADDPSTWVRTILRLADNAPEIASFDLQYTYPTTHGYFPGSPTAFSIEASADCMTWEELYATNNVVHLPTDYYTWLSDGASSNGKSQPEDVAHRKIPLSHAKVHGSYAALSHLRGVSVARGTTLKYEGAGTAPVIRKLKADASGIGTIDGFAFAANGEIVVENAEAGADNIHVPADFSKMSDYGKLANWSVSVKGAKANAYLVGAVTATGIDINRRGMILLVR